MKVKQALVIAAVVSLVLSGVNLIAGSNVIQVKCVDSNGSLLEKVQVQTQGLQQNKVKDEKSKKTGIAEFKKLDDDVYRIWAHHEGFAPAIAEFYHLTDGKTETITLTFEAGADKLFYFEDPTVLQQASQLLMQGGQALQMQQFERAQEALAQSLVLNPSEPNTYHNMGLLEIQTGKFAEATATLTKAVELLEIYQVVQANPQLGNQATEIQNLIDSIPLREAAYRADQAMRERDFEGAEQHLNALIQLNPENANAYYTLAIALTQNKKMEQAEEVLDKAISMDPSNEAFQSLKNRFAEIKAKAEEDRQRGLVSKVQMLNQEQKFAEALEAADVAMEQVDASFHPTIWAERANAYMSLEKYVDAISAYRKYLEYGDAPVDQGIFELGERLSRQGKQAEARIAFEEVLKINPEYAEAYYQIGMDSFYEQGDPVHAKELLTKYLEIGKDEANINNANNVLAVIAMQEKK